MRFRLAIIQEYVPAYRKTFFAELINLGLQNGWRIDVLAGEPSVELKARNDAAWDSAYIHLRQWHFSCLGHRLTLALPPASLARYDVVVVEQARRNMLTYLLLAAQCLGGPKVVTWGHGADHVAQRSHSKKRFLAAVTKLSSHVLVYTDAGKDALIATGMAASRVTVLHNTIDTSELRSNLERASSSLHLGDSGLVGVYIGGLDESKRIDFLLEAAQLIHEVDPRFRLVVGGEGKQAALVETAAAENSWIDYVGRLNSLDKAQVLLRAKVLLNPGRVGLIAVDSLVSGVPIATSASARHAPEIAYLQDGKNCLIIDGDVQAYANAVIELLQETSRLEALRGQCKLPEHLTVGGMAKRFLSGLRASMDNN